MAENHRRYFSVYMQVSKLQSLEEISLLELISLNNINNQPHYEL